MTYTGVGFREGDTRTDLGAEVLGGQRTGAQGTLEAFRDSG